MSVRGQLVGAERRGVAMECVVATRSALARGRRRWGAVCFGVAWALGGVVHATAQEEDAAAPDEVTPSARELASRDDLLALETIIVNAQRWPEAAQDVPIQLTVFDEQLLLDAGVDSTQDFVNLTPNLNLDDSFTYLNTFVTIRGITQISNSDSPLAIFVDGVPQNSLFQFKMNLFDIESIEVLQGPQGALFGRNASGGVVLINSKPPADSLEGAATATYASGARVEATSVVNAPLVEDRVSLRLAGSYLEQDGRIDNAFRGDEADFIDFDYALRGRLEVEATSWLSLDVRAMFNEFEAGALYDSFVPSGDPNDFRAPSSNLPGRSEGEVLDASVTWRADLGFAELLSTTGFTSLEEAFFGDLDFSNPVNNPDGGFGLGAQLGQTALQDTDLITQEVRLTSSADQQFRWLFGGSYIDTDLFRPTTLFVDVGGGFEQAENPDLVFLEQSFTEDRDAWAVFGQIDWDLTPRLTVGGALRYDEDRRRQRDLITGEAAERTFESVQPRFTVTYDVTPDHTIYTAYGRGFRSGGFNAPGSPTVRDETVDTVEVGAKTGWLDGRLIVNGAAYYSFVDDFQFFFLDFEQGGEVIANLEEVRIFGVEMSARALLSEGLEAYATLGTTDAEIRESSLFPSAVGNTTPRNTDYAVNAGLQYRRPLAASLGAFARLDYERRGRRTWQVDNADIQDPIDLVNFRVGLESERWGVYVFGENITDEPYYTDFNPDAFTGLGFDIGFLGQPALFGGEIRVRY